MGVLGSDPFARRVEPPPPPPDPWVAVLASLDQLRAAIENMPAPGAPVVHVEPPDLSQVVMAVQGIKGPATADEIAVALRAVMDPARADDPASPVTAALLAALEKLDFRMQGTQAYGGGQVTMSQSSLQALIDGISVTIPSLDVTDRVARELGVVSGTVEVTNDVGSPLPVSATNLDVRDLTFAADKVDASGSSVSVSNLPATQDVSVGRPVRQKKHIEFIPSSAAPTTIYTGFAPAGTADSAASWTIQRIVFTGTTAIDETWSAAGTAVWNDRTTTSYT